MRVRTAQVKVNRAAALEAVFDLADARHLAWLRGDGRIYADLEKVAGRHNYRVWSLESNKDTHEGVWFAVREDLIAEDGWNADWDSLSFEATREGLGTVGLVGDGLFDRRNTVKVLTSMSALDAVGDDWFDYEETLYSATPLKS